MKATVIAKDQTFTGRDFLTLLDYTPAEITKLLESALEIKKNKSAYADTLKGQSLGMIFENASTRTRVSFEVGMTQLGGHALFLSPRDMQIGRGDRLLIRQMFYLDMWTL
ncbi:ornithine carbamoyltransferase [Halalkalibacter akibai JCM 9157]|uniref:Ornithine carbamoyltransferase n=1 Tax=Halalkalibacter akibai (strain ATCC 43226 / DSM 21942 / CIP 109018 / JCM 9157 / 1139) TaxID=1236973 RepID=W4QTG0_HALA3|nr:ornithine carbamoyltransferase [Halalkalibacter akibai JCM 9157]